MLLFIYGTLMQGGSNHHVLVRSNSFGQKASFLGDYWMDGCILHDMGGAPALKVLADDEYQSHTYKVYGELWDVPNMVVFIDLDPLEGHPNLYCRRVIAYSDEYNKDIEAYVFQYDASHRDVITSGKWRSVTDQRNVEDANHTVESH